MADAFGKKGSVLTIDTKGAIAPHPPPTRPLRGWKGQAGRRLCRPPAGDGGWPRPCRGAGEGEGGGPAAGPGCRWRPRWAGGTGGSSGGSEGRTLSFESAGLSEAGSESKRYVLCWWVRTKWTRSLPGGGRPRRQPRRMKASMGSLFVPAVPLDRWDHALSEPKKGFQTKWLGIRFWPTIQGLGEPDPNEAQSFMADTARALESSADLTRGGGAPAPNHVASEQNRSERVAEEQRGLLRWARAKGRLRREQKNHHHRGSKRRREDALRTFVSPGRSAVPSIYQCRSDRCRTLTVCARGGSIESRAIDAGGDCRVRAEGREFCF